MIHGYHGSWSLDVEKSTRNIQKSWEGIGKLPVVFFGFLWGVCGGYTCEKSFSHRKRWKHQLIFATRLLWFCDVTFRLALVREAKMGDSCWCVSCCRVRGASGASSDTNATTQRVPGVSLLPSSSYHGVVSKIGTRNKHRWSQCQLTMIRLSFGIKSLIMFFNHCYDSWSNFLSQMII
jgi:hypothetical protein